MTNKFDALTATLSLPQLISITIMGLALGMVTATLEPGLIGAKILELAPDRRNTILGLTTFVGLMVALFTQPIMGALSDRARSRWGGRAPFLVIGTVLAIVALLWVALAPSLALLLSGVMALQSATNTIQGPWQALIPDQVPNTQLGMASGLKLLWEGVAAVLGRVIAGQILAREPLWGIYAVLAVIAIPSIVLLVTVFITLLGIRSAPILPPLTNVHRPRLNWRTVFAIDLCTYPAFGWWFLNRLFFWCALIAVGSFLLFFAMDVVGLTEAHAQGYIGQVSAVLGGALLLIAIPVSRLADRVPRKPLVIAGGIMAGIGTLIVLATRDLTLITVGGAIIGAGAGTFVISSWTLITEIVPKAEAARYLGVANIATAGASGLARLVGGTLIDFLNSITGSHSTGYLVLYAIAAALFFLSALAIFPLHAPQTRQ